MLLFRQTEAEALLVKIDDIIQRRCGAVVEVWRPRREPAQDRSFNFANMVELAID